MLILTRRVGETIHIGDDVTVTVLDVHGNQVRVGINAPKQIAVHREEIYERIRHAQNETREDTQPKLDELLAGFDASSAGHEFTVHGTVGAEQFWK